MLGVDSMDSAVASVIAAGGRIVFSKEAVPTIGWTAYATDTEGTLFGMMQFDPEAQ